MHDRTKAQQNGFWTTLKPTRCCWAKGSGVLYERRALQTFSWGKRLGFFLLYCQIIRLQKISHFIPGMKWMHLKGKQESLLLSSSCTAGHCDVSPRCNQGQGWVRERWAPECSRRPQFSSRLYKPFQFKFWLVKLGFFPIKIIFIGSTERTFWNSGRKFPIGYSKQECKQKVMKTMQGITMAFRYLWNNKKTTFYVLHYSKIDTQGPI